MKKHLAKCARRLDEARARKFEANALYDLRAADMDVLVTELLARAYSPTGGVTMVGCRFVPTVSYIQGYWEQQ